MPGSYWKYRGQHCKVCDCLYNWNQCKIILTVNCNLNFFKKHINFSSNVLFFFFTVWFTSTYGFLYESEKVLLHKWITLKWWRDVNKNVASWNFCGWRTNDWCLGNMRMWLNWLVKRWHVATAVSKGWWVYLPGQSCYGRLFQPKSATVPFKQCSLPFDKLFQVQWSFLFCFKHNGHISPWVVISISGLPENELQPFLHMEKNKRSGTRTRVM